MKENDDNKSRTLAAARKLLFEKGYGGTTSADVARLAGTSKATIYRHFGNMNGLLEKVIEAEVARFAPASAAPITDFASFRAAMIGFGANLLEFLNRPETIRFSRMLQEEARSHPEATRLYFEAALEGTAACFEKMILAGAAYTDCIGLPLEARGECYMALLKGHRYERAVLGLDPSPYPDPEGSSTASFDAVFAVAK